MIHPGYGDSVPGQYPFLVVTLFGLCQAKTLGFQVDDLDCRTSLMVNKQAILAVWRREDGGACAVDVQFLNTNIWLPFSR
jgi:hypothetical protein